MSCPTEKMKKLKRNTTSAPYPIRNQFEYWGLPSSFGSLSDTMRTQGSMNVATVRLIKWRTKPATKEAVKDALTFSS